MKDQFKILVAAMFAATLLAGCEADGGSSGVDVVANPNPQSRNVDQDGDGVADLLDNCPDMANAMQEDADGDGEIAGSLYGRKVAVEIEVGQVDLYGSYDLGYKDPAYFSRFFKRRTGLTPGQFRKQRQGG